MNAKAKSAITFALLAAFCGGGVVHMTKFPEPGQSGGTKVEQVDAATQKRSFRLKEDVIYQCEEIGRRTSRFSAQGERFLQFMADSLQRAGFELEVQEYKTGNDRHENIVGVRKGRGQQTILIGTHYDSYGKSPCANASATGVATVLEILRMLNDEGTSEATIICAFFGTGERPHRGRSTMGAQIWLDQAKKDGRKIDSAFLIGSFGKFVDGKGIQMSSFPWYLMYPEVADWVAMYGSPTNKALTTEALGYWQEATGLPARGFAAPAWLPGIQAAEQVPFQEAGIPAMLFSDTGPERDNGFRGRYDDPYQINYDEMALRVEALGKVIQRFAERAPMGQ